jgi:hypothetical protein
MMLSEVTTDNLVGELVRRAKEGLEPKLLTSINSYRIGDTIYALNIDEISDTDIQKSLSIFRARFGLLDE